MHIKNPSQAEIREILLTNKRIAVVGLSNNPTRTSYMVSEAMLDAGYEIIPVNPVVDEVFGIKAVSSLMDIKSPVDIVNVFRRPEHLVDIAKEAVEMKIPIFWGQLGVVNKEAYDHLIANNVTVIMDKCIKIEHALIR